MQQNRYSSAVPANMTVGILMRWANAFASLIELVTGYQAATTAGGSFQGHSYENAMPPPREKPTSPYFPGRARGISRTLAMAAITAVQVEPAPVCRAAMIALESNSATS